ncbi:MAG TPA: translation factor Sua5, partial [Nitrososphaeria archaeon]|nr:translation factor Sua5 [Nitrososphaeria archaeon]
RGLLESDVALSPGMKYRHYAPQKPLVLVESDDYTEGSGYPNKVISIAKSLESGGRKVIVLASDEGAELYRSSGLETMKLGPRSNLFEVARSVFSTLRMLDEIDVDVAVVEGFEERGLGLTIMNRLRKASGHTVIRVR